jgi:hypothetical protein
MKTATYSAPSEIVSDGKKIQFKMSASPKAFAILADGIYSDKITAVIRELSTNASDSHIQAGNKDPFDVHLPTSFNQNFYIRDYGVGLSEEEIETIYTTFFDSNKSDSNDFTGGLGLGSKTPFCYNTKSFTITSFKNGTQLIYSAYIDELGFPCLVKMTENETNEPNGLKVEFPVRYFDVSEFCNKASNVYSYFTTKPKMVGKSVEIADVNKEKFWEGTNQYIKSIYHSDRSGVVMGNIFYPVSFFSRSQFIVYCDIGSLDIETSREGLAYTDKTKRRIEYIKNFISTIFCEIKEKEIESCPSMWEAQKKYSRILLLNPDMNIGKLKWNGKPVVIDFVMDSELAKCTVIRYGYKDCNLDRVCISSSVGSDVACLGFPGGIFLSDSSYATKRVKDNSNVKGKSLLVNNQELLDKFLELTSLPATEIQKTSDLPLNIRKGVSKAKGNKKTTVCRLENTYGKVSSFINIEIDLDTHDFSKCVYICSDRYNLLSRDKSTSYTPQDIYKIECLGDLVQLPTILTVTKSQEEDISKLCENYWDWLKKIVKLKTVETAIVDYLLYNRTFQYQEINLAKKLQILSQSSEKGHRIHDFVEKYNKSLYSLDLQPFINLINFDSSSYTKYDPEPFYKLITKLYPLAEFANSKNKTHIEKYIQLIDQGVF